jgi:outer membrane translocation and assembly module TamA
VGEAFGRARFEVALVLPVASVALFSDAGWVGPDLDDFDEADALLSVGVGVSVLDGLIRLDVARGLRAPERTRWDFYLDAAF